METHNADINRKDPESIRLELTIKEKTYIIPLTENKPTKIKEVFNELIKKLKLGIFKFELKDSKEDLYYEICKEYISQLNNELDNVHKELVDYNLIDTKPAEKEETNTSKEK